MNVLDLIEQRKVGFTVTDIETYDQGYNQMVERHDLEQQLLYLAKLGQAAVEGTSTFCDWQTYDGKDACVHCPAQHACKLRKEQTP